MALIFLFELLSVMGYISDAFGKTSFYEFVPENLLPFVIVGVSIISTVAFILVILNFINELKQFKENLKKFGDQQRITNYKIQKIGESNQGSKYYRVTAQTEYKGRSVKVSKFISTTKTLASVGTVPLRVYFDVQDPTGKTFFFDAATLIK